MQVSHSRVGCFKQCAYKYKLQYIDRLRTYFDNDPANALIIGTALHTGIEKSVEEAIDWYYKQYPIIDDKHIEEAMKLEVVIEKCREVLPIGLHEVKIECDEFIGFIDLLVPVGDNTYDLYDFKYSNNVENYMKSGQLHEYKYYFEKLNPTRHIRKMYFLFAPKVGIRQKKTETTFEFRKRLQEELSSKEVQLKEVEYDETKVEEFLADAKDCIEAKTFNKNPSKLCGWCNFKDYCEKGDDLMILPENKRRNIEKVDKKVIYLYGAPFSGKTYLANKFPDPLMLNTDGNVRFVDAPYIAIKNEVKVDGRITKTTFAWEIFKDTIAELEKKQNDFKTIIVDLLEDTYEHCRLFMYDKLGITHESDDSFRAWDKVRTEYLSTIKRLINLDYENIILISHEDTSKDITKKTGDKITSIKPNLPDKAALKIAGMVDIVARVVADEGGRVLSFKANDVVFGGGRLDVSATEIPCDYDELMSLYDEANKGTVTPVVTPVVTPKPAPVAEVYKDEDIFDDTPKPIPTRKPRMTEVVEVASAEETPVRRRRRA